MPRFPKLPKLDLLRPRLDGRPLTPTELAESRAIQIALVLVVAMYHQEAMYYIDQPVRGGYDTHWDWLREKLAPLAKHSLTVKRITILLDPQNCDPLTWDCKQGLRMILRRLCKDVVLIARQMEKAKATKRQPT